MAPEALQVCLQRHKLLGASEAHRQHLTEAQAELLGPAWRLMRARQLARSAERTRLIGLLEAHAVPAVAYKGSVQHRVLHGTEAGRDSVDLDLWVQPLDFRRTLRLLLADGYGLYPGLERARLDGPLPNELPLRHRRLGLEVDVHQALFPAFYGLEEVDAALRPHIEGHELDATATCFLVYCSGAKDLWNNLRLIADIAAVPAHQDAAIDRLAACTSTRRIVQIGRTLAHELLGTRAPAQRIAVDSFIADLQLPRVDRPSLHRARRYLATRESLAIRARCAARLPMAVRYQDLLQGSVEGPGFVVRRLRRLTRAYLRG